MLNQVALLILPVALAFAAAYDLFTMRIPNKISLAMIAGFFAAALVAGMPLQEVGLNAAVGFATLVATFALFNFNMLGGGDAKLLAAGALWMGPVFVLPFVAYVAIFGGVLSLVLLFYRKFIPATNMGLPDWAMRLHVRGSGIPYGLAIAAAGLVVYPMTDLFNRLAV